MQNVNQSTVNPGHAPMFLHRAPLYTEGFALLYPTTYAEVLYLRRTDVVVMFEPLHYDMAKKRGGPIAFVGSDDLARIKRGKAPVIPFADDAEFEDRRLCQLLCRMDYCLNHHPEGDQPSVNMVAERERLYMLAQALLPTTATQALHEYATTKVRPLTPTPMATQATTPA
jgi:hypothetical protein